VPLAGNVLGDVGLGWFRWADAVVGALDNREARLFVNRACATLGRAWIDGGIEVLNGIVRRFAPPATACYECTMGAKDWEELDQRRSCSLLARNALAAGGTPTTPTTASVIGAIQAQEVVKQLHSLQTLNGAGYVFEGLTHSSYKVAYAINRDCPWHEEAAPVEAADRFGRQTTLKTVWDYGTSRLGPLDAIDLARELVASLSCAACGSSRPVFQPAHRISEAEAVCQTCGTQCAAEFVHSLGPESPWLGKTVQQFGLPAWDVLWARRGEKMLGIELAGDRRLE
jgi:adenylyltransferase/sulfurtransferase